MPGAPFELASSLSSSQVDKMTTTKKPTLQFGGTFKRSAGPTLKKTLDLTKSNKSKSRIYAPKPNDSVIKKEKKKIEEKDKSENGLFDPSLSQETLRLRIRQALADKEKVVFSPFGFIRKLHLWNYI